MINRILKTIQYKYFVFLECCILLQHIVKYPSNYKNAIKWFKSFRKEINKRRDKNEYY